MWKSRDPIPIGIAATRRGETDVTLLTYGAMVDPSLEAADRLSKEGVEMEAIDLRSLGPLGSSRPAPGPRLLAARRVSR